MRWTGRFDSDSRYMRKSKYIEIEDAGASATGKTRIWQVRNVRSNTFTGQIRWWGGFRKYAFFPSDGYLFDADCLAQVIEKLDEVNKARKKKRT